MNNAFGAAQTVSPFPNPPEYASAYTSDRIDNGSAPPPPPPLTEFRVFGEEYRLDEDVVAPLSMADVQQHYSDKNNWKVEMKKLNRSAIAAFLDLVEILIRAPDHPMRVEKMNDLHTIFINMHHLINEFRPAQARDSVRILQERQIEELSEITSNFKEYLNDSRDVVEEQFQMCPGKLAPPPKPTPLSRVKLEDGVLYELVEKRKDGEEAVKEEEEEDVAMEEEGEKEEEEEEEDEDAPEGSGKKKNKKKSRLEDIASREGPPATISLLARQLNEFSLKQNVI